MYPAFKLTGIKVNIDNLNKKSAKIIKEISEQNIDIKNFIAKEFYNKEEKKKESPKIPTALVYKF